LIEGRRRAERLGVVGVALDLRGPTLVARDEQAARETFERVGGREVQRVARCELLGPTHEGDDLVARLLAARRDERRRSAHELHERAARDAVFGQLVRAGGELVDGSQRDRLRGVLLVDAAPVLRRRLMLRGRLGRNDRQRAMPSIRGARFLVLVAAHFRSSSSVTRRAARARVNLVLLGEETALLGIARWFPVRIDDLRDGPQALLGVAVA